MRTHSPFRSFLRLIPAAAAALLTTAPVRGIGLYTPTDLLPLQTGFTVATCYSSTGIGISPIVLPPPDPNGNVVVVWNTTTPILSVAPTNAPASASYSWQFYHNEVGLQNPPVGPLHEWKAAQLGEVFGVALDDSASQNIFVAASRAYGYANWPAGNGPGTVYRLNGTTGAITAFTQLPGASGGTPGPGSGNGPDAALGNLCFHRTPGGQAWLYVTNLGDGLIYRMNPVNGAQTGTFDHGTQALPIASYPAVADNTSLVYTQGVRRPWGIGVHRDRLYYSIFDSMDAPSPPPPFFASGPQPEVWSVGLDSNGNFLVSTAVREFKLPYATPVYTGFGMLNRTSMPVSDIEFTAAGAMILAERYHTGCIAPGYAAPGFLLGAHSTRVLEYTGSSGAWVPSPAGKFRVGGDPPANPWNNSAGGVGPACDGSIWCTGDALGVFQSVAAYGQQRINGAGNQLDPTPLTNSHIIDYDCTGSQYGKSLIGDVDSVVPPDRVRATFVSATCPTTPGGAYTVTLNITNLLSTTMTQLAFGPCPPAFLPPGGQSVVPTPATMPMTLAAGASTNVTVTMTSLPIGGVKCFSIQANPADLLGSSGAGDPFECSPKVCVRLPKCPCMDAVLSNPVCPVYEGQEHSATLVITNQWPLQANWFSLAPCPINELPPGAITVQPNPQGLQPLIPPLNMGQSSPPITVTLPGVPVQNVPTKVCFVVQLLPQFENEGPFCEMKVCITFPPCPPLQPCVTVSTANIQCPTAPPGNYSMNLTITNQGPIPAAAAILTPCPPPLGGSGIPAVPSPGFINLPPLTQGNFGTYPIQLGGVPTTGVTGCFCVTLVDAQQRPICTTVHCVNLPNCPCINIVPGPVICPRFEGQPHTMTLTLTNTGFSPYFWYGLAPCPPQQLPPGALPGIVPGPAGLQPLPPLTPGNSITIPVTLTGVPKTGGKACFSVFLYDETEGHPLCEEKVCVIVPPCPACLPCMAVATPAPVLCPTVQGGPFTTTIVITNNQPVPAVTALLIPCLPGLQPGEVAATPVPGSVSLPPLNQGSSIPVNVALSGVGPGQIGCFCVQLLDGLGNKLCETPVCLTMPQCPPLCSKVTVLDVLCQPSAGPLVSLGVLNQSAVPFGWYQVCPVPPGQLPAGSITGQPQPAGLAPFTPSVPSGGGSSIQVTLPNTIPPAGATFCFLVKFFNVSEQKICEEIVCVNVPPCQCGIIVNHSVECIPLPNGAVKQQLTFTVQNLTNSYGPAYSFAAATILPGAGFAPNVIVPTPNPIPPGGTGTFTTCFTGTKPPKCLDIFLTNAERTRCCPLRLCPLWVGCAPLTDPHTCDLASEFVSENGGLANGSAFITNGTGTPKMFTWSVSPAAVPGCTATLPPNAFFPASGTIGPVSPWSSILVPFTISGAAIPAGQCAGFQFCFQEVSQAQTAVHCCYSKVRRTRPSDPCVIWDPAGRKFPTGAGLMRIAIKNPTSSPLSLSLMLGQSGDTEFSLTGQFPAADGGSTGAGGPPADLSFLPVDVDIPPFGVVPLTFQSRVKPAPLPHVGPIWNEWYLIRLCRGSSPVDPEVIGTHLVHIPFEQPGPGLPPGDRFFAFMGRDTSGTPNFLQCDSDYDEILSLRSSSDLHDWTQEWPESFGLVQAPDGTFLGTGSPLFLTNPSSSAATRAFRTIHTQRQP